MKKIIFISFSFLACLFFAGCEKGADNPDVLMITGTATNPMIKFAAEQDYDTFSLTASATTRVEVDTEITFAVNNGALADYNKLNGTNYLPAPEGSYRLIDSKVKIESGKHTSSVATVEILDMALFDEGGEGVSFVIPVSIVESSGNLNVLDAGRTAYLRVARVMQFTCVDVTPTGSNASNCGYRSYYFDEPCDLTEFSFEFKIYIDSWHTGATNTQITRLANWGPGDDRPFRPNGESSMNLLRLGEGGYANNQLQWLNSHGSIGSNTRFNLKQWYLLTFTYDGFNYRFYVDGKLDNSMEGIGKTYYFDSYEIGMSWNEGTGSGNHSYSQRIPGRMSEIRVWNRPLKAREIEAGLCGVPSNSPGLIAYWKLNEGEGRIYYDASGHGRHLDFDSDKSVSEANGGVRKATQTAFRWVTDDVNKCAQ